MDETQAIKALGALAHPVRLRVFRALVVTGPRGLTPGVMQEGLDIPATTLSFHLKELTSAGLVTAERSSRMLIYRAAYDHMSRLLEFLTENCCEGNRCVAVESNAFRRS